MRDINEIRYKALSDDWNRQRDEIGDWFILLKIVIFVLMLGVVVATVSMISWWF